MASPEEGSADAPLVVTVVEAGTQDGLTHEWYRIEEAEETGLSDIFMRGLVTTSDVRTSFSVWQPERKDATDTEITLGQHHSGANNHVRVSVSCDHSLTEAPSPETRQLVLGHLGAVMMALKYDA